MILLIVLVLVLVVSIFGIIMLDYDYDFAAWIGAVISGFLLLIALITLPVIPYTIKAEMAELDAFKKTIQISRAQGLTEFERATITQDIAKWNETVALYQFHNDNWWDLWIPDFIDTVQLIK